MVQFKPKRLLQVAMLAIVAGTFAYGKNPSTSATTKPVELAVLNTAFSDQIAREYWAIVDQKPPATATTVQLSDFKKKQASDIKALADKYIGQSVRFSYPVADVSRFKTNDIDGYRVRMIDPTRNDAWMKPLAASLDKRSLEIMREQKGEHHQNYDAELKEFDFQKSLQVTQAERKNLICHIIMDTPDSNVSHMGKGETFRAQGAIVQIDWPKYDNHDVKNWGYIDFTITVRSVDAKPITTAGTAATMPTAPPVTDAAPLAPTTKPADDKLDPASAGVAKEITIPATEGRGSKKISLGSLSKGQVMMFQYVRGEWTAWQGDPAGSPDDVTPKNPDVYPVSICEVTSTGVKRVMDIARGTSDKPFAFKADHDIPELVLNMDDSKPRNNKGEVTYRFWIEN